jgi:hypothetical protein
MRATLIACLVALTLAVSAGAQDYLQFQRGFRRSAIPKFPTADSYDGSFNFCRLFYESYRREGGGQGWWTDYPAADVNFMIRLSELTKMRVSQLQDGTPNHLVVRADDEALFDCPFVTIEDAGTAEFTEIEVLRLREYLLKGGFLWVDDYWGDRAWESWEAQLSQVLSPREYPIRDLGPSHALFRMMFEFERIPQIPSIAFWRGNGGATSERGWESEDVHLRGVADPYGRLMVLMTHNTDIADAWEREAEDPRFFYLFSPDGYAIGVNVLLYAMTH